MTQLRLLPLAGSQSCVFATLCQESPKRLKDTEAEGDSAVDGSKSNAEAKLNDVAGPDTEVQEKPREGGKQTADKVRHWSHDIRFICLSLVILCN